KTIIKTSNETNLNLEVPSLPPKRQKEFCQVEFAYSPQNEDELELVVGDIITIVSKDAQDAGWWKGEIHGKVGVFPDNFVKLLPPEGISKSVSSSKIYIKSDQKNTNFGSRDSLKDILNETGLQIATRVKAPKRRPPTSSNNSVGNENNNYINGTSYNESVEVVRNQINIKTEKEETNRISKNIPAKMNAPWMAELKANQEKKKISVNKENVSNNVESSSSLRSVSTSIKENVVMSETLTSRSIVTTTSTTNNLENQIQNQKVPNKPIIVEKEKTTVVAPPTGPTTLLSQAKKEKVESNVENSSNILIQNNNTINTSSIESQDNTESSKVIELEKRVQALESIVEQLRKELLFLKNVNENHSIVKSEIEKYV
uniref:SH3 domain-containing protein n=1 Tax=Megaselia scalaris TaxID=36166 RepID=T1H0S1_MEGSC